MLIQQTVSSKALLRAEWHARSIGSLAAQSCMPRGAQAAGYLSSQSEQWVIIGAAVGEAGLLGRGVGQGRHPRGQDGDPEAGRISGIGMQGAQSVFKREHGTAGTGKGLLIRPAVSSHVRWKGQKLRPDSEGSRKSLNWTSGKALLPSMRDASLVAAAWRMDWRKVGLEARGEAVAVAHGGRWQWHGWRLWRWGGGTD